MSELSLYDLLKSGAHFGHKTSRWNPKMKPFIFTVRNDIHILDLEKTRKYLLKAADYAKKVAQNGGVILFIGTKRQARLIVKEQAERAGMPYVNVRWLGGTFTNFKTIQRTIRKMEKLQDMHASADFQTRYTKKERLMVERELEKLNKLFAGIKDMRRLPEAVFVLDVGYDDISVKESKLTKVPIIGITDSNDSPEGITCVIPSNNDATNALQLIASLITDAIVEGRSTGALEAEKAAAANAAAAQQQAA